MQKPNYDTKIRYFLQFKPQIRIFALKFQVKIIPFSYFQDMAKRIEQLVRANILRLMTHFPGQEQHAEHQQNTKLDANESPYNKPFNRFPDASETLIKEKMAKLKGTDPENILITNGEAAAIDTIFRCFAEPQADNIVSIRPTADFYKSCALLNDVEFREVDLDNRFDITAERILARCDDRTKIILLCSPNNPTGNLLDANETERILQQFEGIVVIDESFADFTLARKFRHEVKRHANLVVLNSMNYAWACAAINTAIVIASSEIIEVLRLAKTGGTNTFMQEKILEMLNKPFEVETWIKNLLIEKERMTDAIRLLSPCQRIFHSDANFILAQFKDADSLHAYLIGKNIAVSNQSHAFNCENCLRITVGSKSENTELISALRQFNQ